MSYRQRVPKMGPKLMAKGSEKGPNGASYQKHLVHIYHGIFVDCIVSSLVKLVHCDMCWNQFVTDFSMCCVEIETVGRCFCFDNSFHYVSMLTYS